VLPVRLADLPRLAGTHLGYTRWREMTQERVNQFADVTEDHTYLHVDVERATRSPFGGTIAHGYLTLSLLAPVVIELLPIEDASVSVNYGLNKVRFPAPVSVGAQFRGGLDLRRVTEIDGGFQIEVGATVEVKGATKPALVAECVYRHYA